MNKALILLLCCFSVSASAQEETYTYYSEKFPKEQAVKLLEETNIVLEVNDDGLRIQRSVKDEKLLLTNTAANFRERQIVYNSFFDITEVEAAAYLPKGNSYSKKKIKYFRTEKIISERVFHDDLMAIKFEYPDLRAGSKIDLTYTEDVLNPFFLPPVYLQDVYYAEKIRVTLQLPNNISVKITKHHIEDGHVNYSSSERKGIITHVWEVDSVKQMESEGGAPDPKYYVPHISFIIEGYNQNGNDVTVLKDLGDLYNWYSGLLDSVNNELSDGIKRAVDSISAEHPRELDKAQALYNWVRSNVKYVAVEDGLGGFIPDDPMAVSDKRFGDCKGMSCLLANMMRYAGLSAYECWIGTRDIPYSYTENYTPFSDNHMITAYNYQGTWMFLDATDKYIPFGYPSSFIQGKEALIGISREEYMLEKVPVVAAENNQTIVADTITIEEETLKGKSQMTVTGYPAGRFNRLYKRAEKKDRFFKYYLESGNDKFSVIGEPEVQKADSITTIAYNYSLPNYLRVVGDKLFVNLSTDKVLANNKIDERTLPIERDNAQKYVFNHVLLIPDGYGVFAVPKDFDYSSELADASLTYTTTETSIIYNLELSIKPIMIQADQIEEWNKLVKKLKSNYRKNIELQKLK